MRFDGNGCGTLNYESNSYDILSILNFTLQRYRLIP